MRFYTIGYGGRIPKDFIEILRANKVKALADVRLRPDRSSMGSYVKAKTRDKGIEALLSGADIEYRSFVELGNIFWEYPDWKERYRILLERAGDILVERLLQEPQEPFCLLCAEKREEDCHRRLIAEYLARNGHDLVAHL